MSFAKIVVEGTLVSDPEKRFTPNDHAVTNFNLSVENPTFAKDNNEPFTVQVTCWRGLAEAAEEQLRKGDTVVVDGKLMINSFQSPEGVQKKSFAIDANTIEKLAGKSQPVLAAAAPGERGAGRPQGGGGGFASRPAPQAAAPRQVEPGFSSEELLTEDDIPF